MMRLPEGCTVEAIEKVSKIIEVGGERCKWRVAPFFFVNLCFLPCDRFAAGCFVTHFLQDLSRIDAANLLFC